MHLGSVKGNISSTYVNSHTDSLLELVRLANTKNLKSGLYYKTGLYKLNDSNPECVSAGLYLGFSITTYLKNMHGGWDVPPPLQITKQLLL